MKSCSPPQNDSIEPKPNTESEVGGVHQISEKGERIRLSKLIIVFLILVLFHFFLSRLTSAYELRARVQLEMNKIQGTIGGSPSESEELGEAKEDYIIQNLLGRILDFPLLTLEYELHPKTNAGVDTALWLSALNSVLALIIIYPLFLILVLLLPIDHRWRKFIHGKGLTKKGAIPEELDRVPLFKMARVLERVQETRYGKMIVVAVFHFLLTIVCSLYYLGTLIGPNNNSFISLCFHLMHLPLSPVFVSNVGWISQEASDFKRLVILSLANSCLVGLIAQIVLEKTGWLNSLFSSRESD